VKAVAATDLKNPHIPTRFNKVAHNSLNRMQLIVGNFGNFHKTAILRPWAQEVSGSNPDAPTIS
jgi:hypothetical protein